MGQCRAAPNQVDHRDHRGRSLIAALVLTWRSCAALLGAVLLSGATLLAHSGPPYPIVGERTIGAYKVSVWADPDATDDGSAAGQFWVVLAPAQRSALLPGDTRAEISIRPGDRAGDVRTRRAEPVNGDVGRQFAALLMDHEGPFTVHVAVAGGAGAATLDASVDATYDLRPPRFLIAVYLMPFLLIGFLWAKLLVRRRHRAITTRPSG
jgi:hypothetical protein